MEVSEYKEKIKQIEDRIAIIQKQYDKEQFLFEEHSKKMEKLGLNNIEEVDTHLEKLKDELESKKNKLMKYLEQFEKKLEKVEEFIA